MTKVNLILINAISMLNRCSVKNDQLKKWVQRQFYESIDIYIEKKRPKTYTGWWTSLQKKNDGDLLAEWDATPYIRIQKVVAPRPSKLCVSHFLCFVYLQDRRIAQMLLITHWTTERHWNKELLSTHLVKPVSRKSNTKLKSKSAFGLLCVQNLQNNKLSYGDKLPTYLYIQQFNWKGWSSFWVIVGGS